MASNIKERPEWAANQTQPTTAQPPKLSEGEAVSLVLDSYVMHIQTNLCQCCGNGERFSSLFEVWVHPTHTRLSRFNKLLPVFGLKLNSSLPIATIDLPNKPIPFCSDCPPGALLAFARSPTTFSSRQAWADTLQRKAQSQHSEQLASQRQRSQTPTVDML